MKKGFQVCSECNRKRERCRVVAQDVDGELVYVCRACWRDLDFSKYLYENSSNVSSR